MLVEVDAAAEEVDMVVGAVLDSGATSAIKNAPSRRNRDQPPPTAPRMSSTLRWCALSAEPFLRKVGDGTKFRILVQQGGAHLLRGRCDPGISQREGITGFDAGGLLEQGL